MGTVRVPKDRKLPHTGGKGTGNEIAKIYHPCTRYYGLLRKSYSELCMYCNLDSMMRVVVFLNQSAKEQPWVR